MTIQVDTAKAALEVTRDEYQAEERRHDHLVAKTQTLATVAALVFAAFSFLKLDNNPTASIANTLGEAFGLIGVILCLFILFTKNYSKVNYEPVLSDHELGKDPSIVYVNLAKTYHQAIQESSVKLDKVARWFNVALAFLIIACCFELAAIVFQQFGGKVSQSNNNTSQGNNTSSGSSSGNSQTSSYGTKIVKRGISNLSSNSGNYGTREVKKSNGSPLKK